jgi:hypothetical protein
MIKGNVQREPGLENSRGAEFPPFLSPAQKVARVETSTEMLRIRHESEENHFEGIAADDESWFQYSHPFSKMFRRLPTDVIPRTQQAIRTKQTMIEIFLH